MPWIIDFWSTASWNFIGSYSVMNLYLSLSIAVLSTTEKQTLLLQNGTVPQKVPNVVSYHMSNTQPHVSYNPSLRFTVFSKRWTNVSLHIVWLTNCQDQEPSRDQLRFLHPWHLFHSQQIRLIVLIRDGLHNCAVSLQNSASMTLTLIYYQGQNRISYVCL